MENQETKKLTDAQKEIVNGQIEDIHNDSGSLYEYQKGTFSLLGQYTDFQLGSELAKLKKDLRDAMGLPSKAFQ